VDTIGNCVVSTGDAADTGDAAAVYSSNEALAEYRAPSNVKMEENCTISFIVITGPGQAESAAPTNFLFSPFSWPLSVACSTKSKYE
jgi:hypothetical protein